MKILFTSDIHASKKHLFSMLSTAESKAVDCIIIGGDIVPHALPTRKNLIERQADYLKETFIPEIKEFRKKHDISIYMDLGNDDLIYNRQILKNYDGELFSLLHLQKTRLTADVDIIGYMNVPPTPFGIKDWEKPDSYFIPYIKENSIMIRGVTSNNGLLEETILDLESDDNIERDMIRLSKRIDRPFIFVSHSPPHKTPLDVIHNGLNIGSVSIRKFIEKWAEEGLLVASFHGHIHESPIISGESHTAIGNVLCFNPGQGNGDGSEFRHVILRLDGTRISLTNR
jgi:Icc-related predicted phosphoesterase